MQLRRVPGRDSAQVVTPFVQVGTYPTRNFAPKPLCRHKVGTISSTLPVEKSWLAYGLWGFQETRRLPMVHRLGDLRDLGEPLHVKWNRSSIIRSTAANFLNSSALAVFSGFASKNGTIFDRK